MVDTLGAATTDGRQVDPRATIDVLNARAWERLQADVQESTALAEEALAYADGLGYDKGIADARRTLCACHVIKSEHEQALSELPAVRELYRTLQDRRGEGSVVNILGSAYGTLGDFPKALELFLDGLAIATELGDQRGEAVALGNIGQVYAELGDLPSGLEHTERALELRRAIDDEAGAAATLMNLGAMSEMVGSLDRARACHEESLGIRRRLGDRLGEAMCLENLGTVCAKQGDADGAERYLRTSLEIVDELEMRQWQGLVRLSLGKLVAADDDRLGEGIGLLRDAVKALQEISFRPRELEAHRALAEAYKRAGDTARALEHFEQAHTLEREVFSEGAERNVQNLRVRYEVKEAQREAEIYRLRNVELARTYHELAEAEHERARYTSLLRTSAETAELLSTILDPAALLSEIIQLLRDRFDLYYVHLFLVEPGSGPTGGPTSGPTSGQLVVRAGSGDVGARLVESRFAIPLTAPRSLVARAATARTVVKVDDVYSEPAFLPNALLPDTRSEVALPLVARGELVGVLDLQDRAVGRFAQADIDALLALSGQIAVAIQNARLFQEVQTTAERLREVDRLKSEFLANMSHELRTPLNSIIGYAELILMGLGTDVDPAAREDIEAIHDNGQQLLHLINDLLDLARIEAGQMRLEPEPVGAAELLERARVTNAGLLVGRPIDMHVVAAPDVPPIQGDRVRLGQILNNLVGNAVKFTPAGHVWLRCYGEGDEVCLEIEDTGPGISESDVAAIFRPFRHADSPFTRRARGAGLGLAITLFLVELHNGAIEVKSRPGVGTVFTVRLPAARSAAPTLGAPTAYANGTAAA
ncbi:MAG: tetratricopeptide repeat protein [Ardenticatenales bacterium]|nr:tetratricopeptide repeat protein [Ardenticatenales bacterium]